MKEEIKEQVEAAVSEIFGERINSVTGAPNPKYGDFSTNAAILLNSRVDKPLYDIAVQLSAEMMKRDGGQKFEKVDATRTGFINFRLKDSYLQRQVSVIRGEKGAYGWAKEKNGKKVLIEFVSANPTGPLHIGHGRWAVIGDDIASLLEASGHQVEREFYINDVGNQIEKLVLSVRARAEGGEVPEGGYGGAYIADLAEQLKADINKPNFKTILINTILEWQKRVLRELGVGFDRFFSERTLHEKGRVKETVEEMKRSGHTFTEDGALWFKSMDQGDDKNRVLVRENGEPTYFAADIAYHRDKYSRGYDQLIDVWGADHHGYVPRLKAALKVLGLPVEKFEVIIGQLVSLFRGSEPVKMSKRTGDMITLEEVLQEIGKDATRFFLTMVSSQSRLEFDLELAKKHAPDNPVYYVQYAHARLCSIFREAGEQGITPAADPDLSVLSHPAERDLMRKLIDLNDEIVSAAGKRAPHQMVEYAKSLAAIFHNYYHKCRVISEDTGLTQARLALCDATRIVLKNVLELLKVEAPERM
ncbi:MAG TPA: arginine--tRNA ligase [Candidatus Omnitrophota bacterium]|nr:arginine--tRNA ligase [Candidatus Omnitrophota bacterium]